MISFNTLSFSLKVTNPKGFRSARHERQRSMADITWSWPRLRSPALALRQAIPRRSALGVS
jgi:hypothetical protein